MYHIIQYFISTDIAAATVDIRMEKIWNENLKNSSSNAFRQLEKTIVDEIHNVLPSYEGVSKPIIRVMEFK